MKLRLALLAATVMAAPLALAHKAAAQPVTGPYVSLGAGYDIEMSQKAKNIYVNGRGTGQWGRIVTNNGWDADLSVGYGFGDGWRVELEGDYGRNAFNKVKVAGNDFGAGGAERRYGVFANALYDMDVGLPWLYPYVGAGIGWQEDNFNSFAGDIDGRTYSFNKTKGSLAYQGIAGLSFPIAYVPGLSATVEYRLLVLAGSRKFNGAVNGLPGTFKVQNEFNHEINVGLRYQLFQPPPPAPAPTPAPVAAAPAPAPAKTYLVFFDWDKYNLTPRAKQIVAQAASDSKTQQVTRLQVSGYTDTSGTAQYNMGLSQRRAKSVANELIADGVPSSEIEIHAYGETHLLVPTGPNVREPQNRRVEIVMQ